MEDAPALFILFPLFLKIYPPFFNIRHKKLRLIIAINQKMMYTLYNFGMKFPVKNIVITTFFERAAKIK